MTVYFSIHYNMSTYREPITKDLNNSHHKLLNWFKTNSDSKGVISANSLLLQSHVLGDDTVIKDASKLCLANRIEICSSLYSSFIPFNLPYEQEFIKLQINNSSAILRELFDSKFIQGFYPPFGIWDARYTEYLESERYKYALVDWFILEKNLSKEPKAYVKPEFLKIFKTKNHDLFVIPSFNLRSVYRVYPDIYNEFLQSGQISTMIKAILKGVEEFEEDLFVVLSLDLNDLTFPRFHSDFDLDTYLTETGVFSDLPITFVKPSEMVSVMKEHKELDIKFSYPFEIQYLKESDEIIEVSPCCNFYIKIFKEYQNYLNEIQNKLETFTDSMKSSLSSLVEYCWNYLLLIQHNFCFNALGEPIKERSLSDISDVWRSIQHLDIFKMIINKIISLQEFPVKPHLLFSEYECGEYIHLGNKIVFSLQQKGGIISNLIDLKRGSILATTPSLNLALSKHKNEPLNGLMYDIISKRFSGQFNMFNESYTFSKKNTKNDTSYTLSEYITGDIVLFKKYTVQHNSPIIKIDYEFFNRGKQRKEFILYSLSKFNLNNLQTLLSRRNSFDFSEETSINENTIVKLFNEEMNTSLFLRIPQDITWRVKKGFGSLDLSLGMRVNPLRIDENQIFSFEMSFNPF